MAASPLRKEAVHRKPTQRSGAADPAQTSYFKLPHEFVDLIAWVGAPGCEQYCLLKILSLQNQRAAILARAGKEPDGWTGPIDPAGLRAASRDRWDLRMFQMAIERLADLGAIERLTRKAAIDRGILTYKEAGPARIAYTFHACTEKWAEIAEAAGAAAKAAEAKAAEEAAALEEKQPHAVVPITDVPIRLQPGVRPATILLEPEVRRSLRSCRLIDFVLTGAGAVEVGAVVDGAVLRCHITAVEAAVGDGQRKGESGANLVSFCDLGPSEINGLAGHTAGAGNPGEAGRAGPPDELAAALASLTPPVLLRAKLREDVRTQLGTTPVGLLTAAVKKRRQEIEAAGGKFGDGLVKNLAAEVQELWVIHGDKAYAKYETVGEPAARTEGYYERKARELNEQREREAADAAKA